MFYVCLKLFDLNIGDAGSFMQSVFGGAVALAGAWVAIKLAEIAISLQSNQHSSETRQQEIEDKRASLDTLNTTSENIERAYIPIACILKGIQDCYISAISLDNSTIEFTSRYIPSGRLDDMPRVLTDEMKNEISKIKSIGTQNLINSLNYLAESCKNHAIQTNPITAFLLKEACPKTIRIGNHMVSISSELQSLGIFFNKFEDHVRDLERKDDIDFIKHLAIIRGVSFQIKDKNGNLFDNAAVRTWLTLSLSLSGNLDAANLFHDILRGIPTGKMMADSFKNLLPRGMPPGLYDAVIGFNLYSGLDESIKGSLSDYTEISPVLSAP